VVFCRTSSWRTPSCSSTPSRPPAGKTRLVWVSLDVKQSLNKTADASAAEGRSGIPYELQTTRRLSAHVFDPDDLTSSTLSTIAFVEPPDARSRVIYQTRDDGNLRANPWQPRGLWRIRAGQLDPNDPTHVTILYDIDGKPGVIDARLGDGDRLMFTPRTGRLVQWPDSNTYTWDLTATSTTQPTK
jgi:hypothetical protein